MNTLISTPAIAPGITTAWILNRLESDPAFCEAMLVGLYARQTSDEKSMRTTYARNGQGFDRYDARFGSSLAIQILDENLLTPAQLYHGRKLLRNYAARQLREIATEDGYTAPAPAPVDPVLDSVPAYKAIYRAPVVLDEAATTILPGESAIYPARSYPKAIYHGVTARLPVGHAYRR